MAKCVFVFLIVTLLSSPISARQQSPVRIGNPRSRHSQSLNGPWQSIVDPYENGIGARYYEDRRAATETALIEYDFASSPQLQVPRFGDSLVSLERNSARRRPPRIPEETCRTYAVARPDAPGNLGDELHGTRRAGTAGAR
jgi:hypothetical protein